MRLLTLVFLALWVAFGAAALKNWHERAQGAQRGHWSHVTVCRFRSSPRPKLTAMEQGLLWLARHQEADGRWRSGSVARCCSQSLTIPVDDEQLTSLCVIAFLGANFTPQNRIAYVDPISRTTMRPGESVRRGLRWLMENQCPDGAFGLRDEVFLLRHSLATLALTHAYGVTNAVAYRASAQRAVSLLDSGRAIFGGWGLTERTCWRDPVITARSRLALREAGAAGLDVATADLGTEPLDGRSLDDERPLATPQSTEPGCCTLGSWNGPHGRVYETARTVVALESTYRWPAALGGAR